VAGSSPGCNVGGMADQWAAWLRTRRSGGDAELARRQQEELAGARDRVLENGRLEPGETVLDVGCGQGLIALGALDRGAGRVIFSDISEDLLDEARHAVAGRGLLERCDFVRAPADDLTAVPDASVDLVTTRSVLIYVEDKPAAFAEFARVLRRGGRISLFEPINAYFAEGESFGGYDTTPVRAEAAKLRELYDAIQPPSDPMVDFRDEDLIALAEAASFYPVNLELDVEVRPTEPLRWEAFLGVAGNPRIPTVGEAMDEVLSAEERRRMTHHLRPLVEEGRGTWRMARAYLRAPRA
jgi:arsenite methyltransferase